VPSKIYYELREQLDQYSVGFPTTTSGVEKKILEKLFTEEAGLVPQPSNARYPGAICNCCGGRCQVGAVTIGPEEVAGVNLDRCIGCGLCVTRCTSGALSLKPKPEGERHEHPRKPRDAMMQMARERGKSLIPLAFTETSQ
jgi:MinD superfamily P-loop ATPase